MKSVAQVVGQTVAGQIVYYTVGKLGELGYLTHYKSNIEALKKENENLKGKKEEVQQKIIEAENNLEVISYRVQIWVECAIEITIYVDNLLEDNQKEATHRCFNINLLARYKFGKKAFEKVNEIKELLSYHPHDLTVTKPSSSREIFRGFESRKENVRDIMEALDNENINIIGICGMGGVGKTTIVNEVCTQAEKKFDKIVMVVVSQNPNITNIQEEIAKELDLHLEQRNTPSSRTTALCDRIKKVNKIMIILDDVWKRLDLTEDFGIPFGKDHKGCKIVLTTRRQDVCKEMDAQTFYIECLPGPENWHLFRETLGETANSLDSKLENIAIKVAQECRGLPIAIVTVGMALKKHNKDVWIDFIKQLEKPIPGVNIPELSRLVYSGLELSYKYLESNEAKSLFLLCILFPGDFEIDVGLLAQYGMGLRLFQDVNTIEGGRVRLRSLVSTLVSSFMLLKGRRHGHVKMHDVIREAAIVIASKEEEKKYMVKAGVGLRDWPNSETALFQSYTGISLMYNDIHKLPDKLESPKLQVLLLQNKNDFELRIPTNFFRGMENLRVLDMGGNRIRSMPASIKLLVSLKMLCLDGCKLGDNISIIGALEQLEILNLRNSDITKVPEEFRQLTHLMLLDLRECYSLKEITPGVISSLRKLEELYIALNFIYWAGIEGGEGSRSNASIAEIKSLSRLTSLSICVPNINLLPHDLRLQSLTEFDIIIGCKKDQFLDYEKHFFDYNWSVNPRLALSYDTADYNRLSVAIRDLLKRTKGLILIDCKGSTNILKDFDNNEGFVELEHLYVRECNDMKYLLDTVDGIPPKLAFPNLKRLRLESLPNFMEICHGQLPAESFSKLQKLDVESCDSMSNVFDLEGQRDDINLLSSPLEELETLTVRDCDNMEEIGTYNKDGINQTSAVAKCLNTNMSFTNLINVKVTSCNRLRNIFTPSIAEGLAQLTKLHVAFCGMMKAVVDLEDQALSAKIITFPWTKKKITLFPRLVWLELWKLENIWCFCTSPNTITFPSLEKLGILKCPKMGTFGNGDVITPNLNNVRVGYVSKRNVKYKDIWKGDLNATVQHIFNNHERDINYSLHIS